MKRLYNLYSAEIRDEDFMAIENIISVAVKNAWDTAVSRNICVRDTEAVCHETLSLLFAEERLKRAYKNKKPVNIKRSFVKCL